MIRGSGWELVRLLSPVSSTGRLNVTLINRTSSVHYNAVLSLTNLTIVLKVVDRSKAKTALVNIWLEL